MPGFELLFSYALIAKKSPREGAFAEVSSAPHSTAVGFLG